MLGRIAKLMRAKPTGPEDGDLLLDASGDTVPSDGATGYATGCLFKHTDGGAGTSLYVNEGSGTSADFNALAGA